MSCIERLVTIRIVLINPDVGTNLVMVKCRMPAPPNPPDLAQAIAAMLTVRDEQTALHREIVEQGRAQRHEHHHQPAIPGYEQFQNTQLPLFHKADEPVEADSWLRTIESKFTLHPYNDGDKAGFAAQQLRVPHALGGTITWPCFPRALGSPGPSLRKHSGCITFQRE